MAIYASTSFFRVSCTLRPCRGGVRKRRATRRGCPPRCVRSSVLSRMLPDAGIVGMGSRPRTPSRPASLPGRSSATPSGGHRRRRHRALRHRSSRASARGLRHRKTGTLQSPRARALSALLGLKKPRRRRLRKGPSGVPRWTPLLARCARSARQRPRNARHSSPWCSRARGASRPSPRRRSAPR